MWCLLSQYIVCGSGREDGIAAGAQGRGVRCRIVGGGTNLCRRVTGTNLGVGAGTGLHWIEGLMWPLGTLVHAWVDEGICLAFKDVDMKWTHIALHEADRGFQVSQRCTVMAGTVFPNCGSRRFGGSLWTNCLTVRKEKLGSEALPRVASVLLPGGVLVDFGVIDCTAEAAPHHSSEHTSPACS